MLACSRLSLSSHVYEEAVLLSQHATYQPHKMCPTAYTMSLHATLVLQASNPFMFKHVTHLKSSQHLDDIGPCVVMATPSMLQSGLSRYLLQLHLCKHLLLCTCNSMSLNGWGLKGGWALGEGGGMLDLNLASLLQQQNCGCTVKKVWWLHLSLPMMLAAADVILLR